MMNDMMTKAYVKAISLKGRAKDALNNDGGMEMLQMMIIVAVVLAIAVVVILFGDRIMTFFKASDSKLSVVQPATLTNPKSS